MINSNHDRINGISNLDAAVGLMQQLRSITDARTGEVVRPGARMP